ncbi:hypothetical protein [Streptomyces dubilierae]|uniref:Uncharacterized protein n=1 Tax=Streptomyces dubilierae TaxID=3075533 RepID=A0ABU2PIG4_9ACTN|nr:hypothetical protein [Streptomyces sp. DSM 41921]MDT0390824.1 hypothetical protein [Streptomyces sp. DSM 41921]
MADGNVTPRKTSMAFQPAYVSPTTVYLLFETTGMRTTSRGPIAWG